MTDLRTRFQSLDSVSPPDLWYEIEERAASMPRARQGTTWVLVAVVLLLALAIAGAALIGSGIVKLPITVEATATPTPSASAEPSAIATPTASEPVAAVWTTTGSMAEGRPGHTLTLLADGTVLVAGGQPETGADPTASAEVYDPSTGEWTATGNMTAARINHTATLLPDGRVLVAGGIGTPTSESFANILASAELYDPDTGTWTATRDMAQLRVSHVAAALPDGTVLVAGGGSSSDADGGPLDSAEVFDPSTGRWTAGGTMINAGPGRLAATLADGRVLVIGGGDGTAAELYDPDTGQWTATGSTVEPRFSGFAASVLSDGSVLLAGAMSGSGASASAELYDPDTGEWTATGDMLERRLDHSLTLLPDGTVLAAGGSSSVIDRAELATAELFDPVTGTWSATENLGEARTGHAAALLADGAVLVVGGNLDAPTSAELYEPGT